MRKSKYWDNFEGRIDETVTAIKNGEEPKVRRVACFITEKCNFRCKYCNGKYIGKTMSKESFVNMLHKHKDAIIHITGGEPSIVPWLYPFLNEHKDEYQFHLNTNAFILPPSKAVKRLKISLDSCDARCWDKLVGKRSAHKAVVENIKASIPNTTVSLTYTLNKQNYKQAVDFAKFCAREFPGLYAIFFSVYKGVNKEFIMSEEDVNAFFYLIIPELIPELNTESASLLNETIDEKVRLMQGVRFRQNLQSSMCYLSMSERVFSPDGNEYTCSHLYRDNIFMEKPFKHEKCRYGCNRRLVQFNEEVEARLI